MTNVIQETLQALVSCQRHVFHRGLAEGTDEDRCLVCGIHFDKYIAQGSDDRHNYDLCECYGDTGDFIYSVVAPDAGARCLRYKNWWEHVD